VKNRLNIFCNNNIKNFLPYFLSDYELTIMKLDQIKDNIQASQANIIIISKNDIDLRDYGKLNENCLIISNLKNLNFNNKSNILNSPLSINHLKNRKWPKNIKFIDIIWLFFGYPLTLGFVVYLAQKFFL